MIAWDAAPGCKADAQGTGAVRTVATDAGNPTCLHLHPGCSVLGPASPRETQPQASSPAGNRLVRWGFPGPDQVPPPPECRPTDSPPQALYPTEMVMSLPKAHLDGLRRAMEDDAFHLLWGFALHRTEHGGSSETRIL